MPGIGLWVALSVAILQGVDCDCADGVSSRKCTPPLWQGRKMTTGSDGGPCCPQPAVRIRGGGGGQRMDEDGNFEPPHDAFKKFDTSVSGIQPSLFLPPSPSPHTILPSMLSSSPDPTVGGCLLTTYPLPPFLSSAQKLKTSSALKSSQQRRILSCELSSNSKPFSTDHHHAPSLSPLDKAGAKGGAGGGGRRLTCHHLPFPCSAPRGIPCLSRGAERGGRAGGAEARKVCRGHTDPHPQGGAHVLPLQGRGGVHAASQAPPQVRRAISSHGPRPLRHPPTPFTRYGHVLSSKLCADRWPHVL
jgi:hypothetical protein